MNLADAVLCCALAVLVLALVVWRQGRAVRAFVARWEDVGLSERERIARVEGRLDALAARSRSPSA